MRTARQRRQIRFASTESKHENRDSQNSKDSLPLEEEQIAEGTAGNFAKELEKRNAQIADLNDKTLRLLADMENVRMIARRDVENAKTYAITPFAKALLSVADNLGLALNAVPRSEPTHKDTNAQQLAGLVTGIDATEAELLKVFSQHGIHRFGDVGDKFDPTKYQAMYEAPSPDCEPGTVISVTKLGYTIGDRVLRPAEVGVSRSA